MGAIAAPWAGCSQRTTRRPSRASLAATAKAVFPPPRTTTVSSDIPLTSTGLGDDEAVPPGGDVVHRLPIAPAQGRNPLRRLRGAPVEGHRRPFSRRQVDGGGGVRGDDHPPLEPPSLNTANTPVALDAPIDGVQGRPGGGEPRRGTGAQDEVLVPRILGVDLDPGDHLVEPGPDRPVGVVVERVHGGVLESALPGPAVPALP